MNRDFKVVSRRIAGFLAVAALVGGFVLLQAPNVCAEDEGDPAASQGARAVRLSFVEGEVHLYQGNQPVADQAVANTPLFEGARIETGNDGRAEIQFEDGSVARLSPESSLTLTVLRGLSANAERNAEMSLNNGLAYFELQGDTDSNHTRLVFGGIQVTANGYTVLRLNLDKAPGEVAVFSGNAHIDGAVSPPLDLHGGESVALNGTDLGNSTVAETIEPDSWDAWNTDRDQELSALAADQTPATENLPDNKNPAWGDLDANGNWYDVPDQGYVWSPNEATNPNWDPYDNGYWMNTPGYGYMWVSGYPWGYMPYSCGSWNYFSTFGWGWSPGMCNPWWGGGGGWVVNIGFAPPRYRYPVRPRPRNPRPMTGHEPAPMPLIAVNRHAASPSNTMLAPRDRTGTVMIAGRSVNPLRPIQQQPSESLKHPRPVFSGRPSPNPPSVTGNQPRPVFQGGNPAPPRSVFQGGKADPRPVTVPARPGPVFSPSAPPRPAPTYNPRPAPTYNPPPAPRPAPSAPSRPSSPPPSAPSHVGGGAVHTAGGGGGGHPASGPHR
jgi:hypothetical protein